MLVSAWRAWLLAGLSGLIGKQHQFVLVHCHCQCRQVHPSGGLFFFGPVVRRTFFLGPNDLELADPKKQETAFVCDGCAAVLTDGLVMGKCYVFEDET